MKYISLTHDNLFSLILYAISSAAQIILIQVLENYSLILFMFMNSISLLFLIFIEIISSITTQRRDAWAEVKTKQKLLLFKNRILPIKAGEHVKNKKIKYISCLIINGLLFSIQNILHFVILCGALSRFNGTLYFGCMLVTWIIQTISTKQRIFRHQLFALCILFILLTVYISIYHENNFSLFVFVLDNSYLYTFISIGCIIVSIPLREVIENYAINILFIRPYRLLFYEGVLSMAFNIVFYVIIQIINCKQSEELLYNSIYTFCANAQFKYSFPNVIALFNYSSLDSLYAYLHIVITALVHTERIRLNETNGPSQRYNGDYLACTLFMILNVIAKDFKIWIDIVLVLFLILGCLIYNENIRINICKLSYDTKAEIQKRANCDFEINENTILIDPTNPINDTNNDSTIEFGVQINRQPADQPI